jgi:hypothetical protein
MNGSVHAPTATLVELIRNRKDGWAVDLDNGEIYHKGYAVGYASGEGRIYIHFRGARVQRARVIAALVGGTRMLGTGLQVDHLDSNPMNDAADNLEWVTPSENIRRARVRARPVTPLMREILRGRFERGQNTSSLAREFKMARRTVRNVVDSVGR